MSLILSIPFNNSTRNVGLQKNTITSVPSVTPSYIAGPVNNALSFNGSTYWKSQGITLGADATICFWSKTSTNGRMPWVLESNASNILCLYESTYYTLNTGDGNANLFKTDSNASISVLRDNVWHHFAVTFGDGVAKLYIDGLYKGKAITFRNPTTTNKPIKIGGGYQNAHSYDWNGGIADFRVYDHCLMDSDIQRIYNGDTKMLQVSLPFNKDCRNVGLENVKPTSAGTFQIVSDTTGLKCAKFGASTGYVKIPHDIFKKNTEMSMTFSINFNSWNTSYATPIGIFKNSNAWTGNTFTFLRISTSQKFSFSISDGTSSTQSNLSTPALSLGTWYHFACVYKDKKMYLYKDGNLLLTSNPSFGPSFTAATLAIVGASTTGGSYQTDSKMSNVRFYNLALTDEDVKRIYQNYEFLEYLEFKGAQYVSLPKQTSNSNIKIIFDFCPDSLTHSQPTFMGIAGKSFQLYRGSTTAISLWWKSNGAYSIGAFNTDSHNILELNFDSNTFSYNFNGTSNSYSNTELYPIVKAGNILIGGYNPGTSYPFFGKIYRIKVYSDNVLTLDLIPCKKNNIKQFFDKVSTNYYQSSSNPF